MSGHVAIVSADVDEVVRLVREAKHRSYVCATCDQPFDTFRLTGRPPTKCEKCDPSSPAWIRERTERPLRDAVIALDDRVQQLQHVLNVEDGSGASERVKRFGADRAGLGRAVRMVAYAEGARGTAEALLDLAVVAQGWAAVLLSKAPGPVE